MNFMPYALIVDDDLDFIPALSQIVQQEGYHVRVAHSLEEARLELQNQIPDIALIDLLLPDGDGIQLVRDLTLTASTKVLVITGFARRSHRLLAKTIRYGPAQEPAAFSQKRNTRGIYSCAGPCALGKRPG